MTYGAFEVEPGAPRRVALRRSRTVRLAASACALVCTAAVHATATAHLGAIDALWLAGATLAALGVSFVHYERRQPALLELTPEGLAAFDGAGRALFQGRIVGFSGWAERLLVLAVAGADSRRSHAFVVCADAIDAGAFRALAVRGRHAVH
ncbi:hypothetical protein [Trinickia sp.]|uniref:hypothetical protein n=1 Tax=Trinickia sp. TaxID=2571163 RepID=UPI003F80F076